MYILGTEQHYLGIRRRVMEFYCYAYMKALHCGTYHVELCSCVSLINCNWVLVFVNFDPVLLIISFFHHNLHIGTSS
jgi:hypothetical protein